MTLRRADTYSSVVAKSLAPPSCHHRPDDPLTVLLAVIVLNFFNVVLNFSTIVLNCFNIIDTTAAAPSATNATSHNNKDNNKDNNSDNR